MHFKIKLSENIITYILIVICSTTKIDKWLYQVINIEQHILIILVTFNSKMFNNLYMMFLKYVDHIIVLNIDIKLGKCIGSIKTNSTRSISYET